MKNAKDITKNLGTYLSLCTEVYELSKQKAPEDAYAFYRNYVKSAEGLILEPMCGTGRFLIPLLEEGFDVAGFDASYYMLAKLHKKAQAKNLKPNVWHSFVQDFGDSMKYDLIFIPDGSFCLITDENEITNAIKTFYNSLADGGILLFEAVTPSWKAAHVNTWTGKLFEKANGKKILLNSLTLPDYNNIRRLIHRYELVSDNQIIHTEIEDFQVRLFDLKELADLLEDVGFKHIRTLKAAGINQKPSEDDETVAYECRK